MKKSILFLISGVLLGSGFTWVYSQYLYNINMDSYYRRMADYETYSKQMIIYTNIVSDFLNDSGEYTSKLIDLNNSCTGYSISSDEVQDKLNEVNAMIKTLDEKHLDVKLNKDQLELLDDKLNITTDPIQWDAVEKKYIVK